MWRAGWNWRERCASCWIGRGRPERKARECREFLERLEGEGRLELPTNARVSRSGHEPEYRKPSVASLALEGELSEIQPVVLEVVRSGACVFCSGSWWTGITTWATRFPLALICSKRIGAGTGGGLCAVVESGVEDAHEIGIGWDDATPSRAEPAGVVNAAFCSFPGCVPNLASRVYP